MQEITRLPVLSIGQFRRRESGAEAVALAGAASAAGDAAALNFLALTLLDAGKADEAEVLLLQATALTPEETQYFTNLGQLHREGGRLERAEQCLLQALALDSGDAEALAQMARVKQMQGDFAEAADYFRKALMRDDGLAECWIDLGVCYEQLRESEQAKQTYLKALDLEPGNAAALTNLAGLRQKAGDLQQAEKYYRTALDHCPGFAAAHNNLGLCLFEMRRWDEALTSILNALALDNSNAGYWRNLADVYAYLGENAQAAGYYRKSLQLAPSACVKIRLATLLPVIYHSTAQLSAARQTFTEALAQLLAEPSLTLADPVLEVRDACFYLAYQGENNRALKQQLAQLFIRACPSLPWRAPHVDQPRRGKVRIGFLSKFLYHHSIGKTSRGLIEQLPRARFWLALLLVPPFHDDDFSRRMRADADQVVELTPDLATARSQIAELQLDILFYQDIGMEPFSYFLAFSRLARVQCTSFGHPETTGIANMDYFISSSWFEAPEAQQHYSERLHLLAGDALPCYYYRPPTPPKKSRADFGLSDADHLYLCPQTLFKFHPDFDALLREILTRDAKGKIVLLEAAEANFAQLLRQRFQHSLAGLDYRVLFLPRLASGDFLALLRLGDAVLDIPAFNGMNSTLEALSVATPVVTWPGSRQCSRHGAGLYGKMGIDACIAHSAEEYVRIAVRLANDAAFSAAVREQIAENNALLFEDAGAVAAFADFFENCLR